MIDAWLGHSTKVAEKHYLQVTEEHWARSLLYRAKVERGSGAPIGAPITYTTRAICTPQASENTHFSQGNEGLCRLTEVYEMPLVGDCPNNNIQANINIRSIVPLIVPPSEGINNNTPKNLSELVAVWESLNDIYKNALLTMVGQLSTHYQNYKAQMARQETPPTSRHWHRKGS